MTHFRTALLGGTGGPEVAYLASGIDTSDSGGGAITYTWTGVDFGAAHSDRHLVAIIASTSTVDISSCTLGGVTATALVTVSGLEGASSAKTRLRLYHANVPTGTSGTVSFSLPAGSTFRGGYVLYRLVDWNMTPYDTASDGTVVTASQGDADVNTVAGGLVIAGSSFQNGGGSTWTGATEDADLDMETDDHISGAHDVGAGAASPRTVNAACALTALNGAVAAVSFQPT